VAVPAHPGLFSAQGLLDAPLQWSDVRSVLLFADELDGESETRTFATVESRAAGQLAQQGADAATISFSREYDARYRGQSFELTVAHDSSAHAVASNFHHAHRERYGYDAPGEPVEIVNARLTATARVASGPRDAATAASTPPEPAAPAARAVWIDGASAGVPVYQRARLPRERIGGPAIVEAYDSTTYVAPGWTVVAESDLLVLEREAAV
jgi:N-methylhydantoinase A